MNIQRSPLGAPLERLMVFPKNFNSPMRLLESEHVEISSASYFPIEAVQDWASWTRSQPKNGLRVDFFVVGLPPD